MPFQFHLKSSHWIPCVHQLANASCFHSNEGSWPCLDALSQIHSNGLLWTCGLFSILQLDADSIFTRTLEVVRLHPNPIHLDPTESIKICHSLASQTTHGTQNPLNRWLWLHWFQGWGWGPSFFELHLSVVPASCKMLSCHIICCGPGVCGQSWMLCRFINVCQLSSSVGNQTCPSMP